MNRRRVIVLSTLGIAGALGSGFAWLRDDLLEKRVAVLEPGRLVRGAWQRPAPLRRLIDREKIRTIVSLTAINRDDPKYVAQAKVVQEKGIKWVIVPMRGSRATLEQMAEAADLVANPDHQPAFFHCVAGHHRTSLVHAAYRIRHEGWSADQAWREVSTFPWARPDDDVEDRHLIEAFAQSEHAKPPSWSVANDASSTNPKMGDASRPGQPDDHLGVRVGPDVDEQLRGRRTGSDLSLRADGGE